MQDEVSFDSSGLKTFQNKSQFGCFCMHFVCKVVYPCALCQSYRCLKNVSLG